MYLGNACCGGAIRQPWSMSPELAITWPWGAGITVAPHPYIGDPLGRCECKRSWPDESESAHHQFVATHGPG